jgi:hypothetical protein
MDDETAASKKLLINPSVLNCRSQALSGILKPGT